ncbi:MAG: ABC transporter ATP-binding protein [Pirellulaceae bacterium]|nr:ABC transporter ATP-binding protein [Pirellulaceae bacterium]
MICVQGLCKAYRDVVAVDDLSFEFEAGSIIGLVGPNGAGKTTTMRAVAGIIPATRGRMLVAGSDVIGDPIETKRRVAYVADDPKLFDALTVWEHLDFVHSVYQVEDWSAKADNLLEQFELTEKRDTPTHELSRGMRQKVAICCAYLYDPQVLLFDEPLTGLDPRAIRTMKDSVAERAEAGATLMVSSHLLGLVEDLCSHLLLLHQGKSLFCGTLRDALDQFVDQDCESTLEDVFFRATES